MNEKVAKGDTFHPHDFIKHDKRHLEYRSNENNNKHQSTRRQAGCLDSKFRNFLCKGFQCKPSMMAQKEDFRKLSGSPQEALKKPSGSPQEALRKPSERPQEALRKPSGCPQETLTKPSQSPHKALTKPSG